MNKKHIKIIINIGIFIILLVAFKLITQKTTTSKVKEYITKKGFNQVEKTNIYSKEISEITIDEYFKNADDNIESKYQTLYFDLNNYQLSKTQMEYRNNIYSYFTPTYNYKNNSFNFEYEITFKDGYINFYGEYDIENKDFICDIKNYKNMNAQSSSNQEIICNKILYDMKSFSIEALELIDNSKLINEMKKEKNT